MNNKKNMLEVAIHILVWIVLFFMPVALSSSSDRSLQDIAMHFWLQLSLLGTVFYINYLWAVDRLLFRFDSKIPYFLFSLVLLVLMIFCKTKIFEWAMSLNTGSPRKSPPPQLAWFMDSLMYMVPIAFAIAIKSGKQMLKVEYYKSEAEKARLEAELQHLKFQLQPHFFFNALNNIYSLIEIDPPRAQQTVHSLSKLMRHLLKTSDETKVSLQDELDFLHKYIDLMQLRLSSNTTVRTDFDKTLPQVYISPFLFISIVENAFKHGVSAQKPSEISFFMSFHDHSLVFRSKNTYFPKDEQDYSGSGIGLSNLRKRLALLYPNRYNLESKVIDGMFSVSLSINLSESI